jgi:hypothetical protein
LDEEPADITVDDALLEKFKDNPQLYNHLLYAFSAGSKVQISAASDFRRKAFDELAEKGFMRRGQEIPIEDILLSMTLKETRDSGFGCAEKFSRKANAIEFLKTLSDLQQRLEEGHIIPQLVSTQAY